MSEYVVSTLAFYLGVCLSQSEVAVSVLCEDRSCSFSVSELVVSICLRGQSSHPAQDLLWRVMEKNSSVFVCLFVINKAQWLTTLYIKGTLPVLKDV